MVCLLVASCQLDDCFGDAVLRKVAQVIVVFKNLEDLLQAASFKAERLLEHFIDGCAANDGEMTQVVVVRFEEEGLLIHLLGQLDQSQQVMLSELPPSLLVYVDPPDTVTVETGSPVIAIELMN